MTYENYYNSLSAGEVVMSLMEWEQALGYRGNLAVYTVASRLKGQYGQVQHFTVLAHSMAEAKRLAANHRHPNNIHAATALYANLEVCECQPVSKGACVVDYFTETVGL